MTLRAQIALAVWSCGCMPPDAKQPKSDPDDTALVHAWRIEAYLLSKHTSLSDEDAIRHRDRTVTITQAGYVTPWHGTCEESASLRRSRPLAEVAAELLIDRSRVLRLGFTDPLVEYRLTCNDIERRTPALTVYVANAHALTCFGGICYALVH
ncbi:MAG TPA: hypothetical protein VNO30_39525 [Kofleriaceae bacterium]|nr:hypothetical protein [Kofleriaceae bacterium]